MAATMTCLHCGASITGTIDEALTWNKNHDAECPALAAASSPDE